MPVRSASIRRSAGRLILLVASLTGGCGVVLGPDDAGSSRLSLNVLTMDFDEESIYVEAAPNDLLESAEYVPIAEKPRLIRGRISGSEDVDVFDLGPIEVGDRIVVEMTPAQSLNAAIALFDGSGAMLLVNDHRNVYQGKVEPFIDVFIRESSPACYVAVSATPGFGSSGDYALATAKEFSTELPAPRPDVVLLVFGGGDNVRVGSRPAVNVPAFDAEAIASVYAGATDEMIQEITDRVRRDYAAYDVTILANSDPDALDGSVSRIFFGTFDDALLGVAEGIDEFNATEGQTAVVFTDTFEAFMRLEPSVAEMGQAIANVASHEIGHLLGMVHTFDPVGLMDVTASLRELTLDQAFTRSPLFQSVFPLGEQDAVRYLLEAVGGDPVAARSKALGADRWRLKIDPTTAPDPARGRFRFSSCSLSELPD